MAMWSKGDTEAPMCVGCSWKEGFFNLEEVMDSSLKDVMLNWAL